VACNCGGASAIKEYIFVDPKSGRQYSYRTEIEAQAAQVRAGGGGSIRAVPR
jgi:hypothetical protein